MRNVLKRGKNNGSRGDDQAPQPFQRSAALLSELFVGRVVKWDGSRFLLTRKHQAYLVTPSVEYPKFIVPWTGPASRAFFRLEASRPWNSRATYTLKWLLACLGLAQFFARGDIVIVHHD